jgi:hypothetical protein
LNCKTCLKKNYFRSKKMVKVQKVTELRAFTVFCCQERGSYSAPGGENSLQRVPDGREAQAAAQCGNPQSGK